MRLGARFVVLCSFTGFPPCVEVSVKVKIGYFFRDSHLVFRALRAEGGSVAISGNTVLKGYISYYVPLVFRSQYVA